MYYFVRVIIYVLFIITYIILLKKAKPKKVIKIIIASFLVVISLTIWLLPFENYLVSFSSAESAFWYSNFNTKVFKEVKNNDHVIFIYSDKSSNILVQDYKKYNSGWKIFSPNMYTGNADVRTIGTYIVTIKQLQDSNTKFVMLSNNSVNYAGNNSDVIKDKFNTSFDELYFTGNKEVIYFALIDNSLSNYYITINEKKIDIN